MEFQKLITNIIMGLKIQPLSDRVVVTPQAAETKTASGLYIPDSAKEKPQQGTIAAVGNGKKDHKMTVKVGDTVLYGKYAGTGVKTRWQRLFNYARGRYTCNN